MRERWWGGGGSSAITLGGVLVLCSTSCGERREVQERIALARDSLQVQVGAERDVERYPELRVTSLNRPLVTCGTIRCFAFYLIGNHTYGSRLDKTGQVVDQPPVHLGRGGQPIAAGARDDDFVVIWPGYFGERKATRLRGSDGQIVGDVTQNLPQADNYRLESTGSSWLLLYSSATSSSAVVKTADSFASIGSPFPADFHSTVIPGTGQYLIAQVTNAFRISEQSGAVLDVPPIIHSKYDSHMGVVGAYKDGIYLLAFTSGDNVFGTRIRASDGARLDPDDDFNQISGAKVLCSAQSVARIGFAHRISDSILVSWTSYDTVNRRLRAARVDVATLTRLAGPITSSEVTIGGDESFEKLHLSSDWGMGIVLTGALPLEVLQSPLQITAPTLARPIGIASQIRTNPSVASNGSTFFVVWETAPSEFASGPDNLIRGTRIDAATGAYLDDPPLALGLGTVPVVASNGSDYLVAWASNYVDIERRVISASGQVGPTLPAIRGFSNASHRFILTSNKRYFFLTHYEWNGTEYQLTGTRFGADGSIVDVMPLVLGTSTSVDFETTGDTAPPENMRTFVTFYSKLALNARRVRSETGAVIEPVTNVGNAGLLHATTDGTRLLVAYRDDGALAYHANLVDPVTGVVQNASPVSLTGISYDAFMKDAWHDGKSYLFAMSHADPSSSGKIGFSIRRWTSDLQPLDSAVSGSGTFVINDYEDSLQSPSAATAGPGRSAFVYARLDPLRLSSAIKLRLITNDGLPASGSEGADGGGTDGASGSAGAAGMDGSAGADASPATGGLGGIAGTGGQAGAIGSGAQTDSGSGAQPGTGGTPSDASTENAGGVGTVGGSAASRDAAAAASGTSRLSEDSGCGCRYPVRTQDSPVKWTLLALFVLCLSRRPR